MNSVSEDRTATTNSAPPAIDEILAEAERLYPGQAREKLIFRYGAEFGACRKRADA